MKLLGAVGVFEAEEAAVHVDGLAWAGLREARLKVLVMQISSYEK